MKISTLLVLEGVWALLSFIALSVDLYLGLALLILAATTHYARNLREQLEDYRYLMNLRNHDR